MAARTVTMQLPENIYLRLQQTAQATKQSFDAILLRTLQVGSPPAWETAPAEFQADLAALDRLDDTALWRLARIRTTATQMDHYQTLLDKNWSSTTDRHFQPYRFKLKSSFITLSTERCLKTFPFPR